VIKYLGSKRRLVPLLSDLAMAVEARRGLDLFTGTTRVAQGWRATGVEVTAVDMAGYAEVLARTYVAWSPAPGELSELGSELAELGRLPGRPGYVTRTFAEQARFFHPDNAARIDAIRFAIADRYADHRWEPMLLTALLEAADRVDSTTGVQMAYLKAWAPRAMRPLELRPPRIPDGPAGAAVRARAEHVAGRLGRFDIAYLDPPYNQHRYFTNYHVWETLVAGDEPEHYGVACKRIDARDDPATRSAFNDRRMMPAALQRCLDDVDARVVVLSHNDESWLGLDQLVALVERRGKRATVLAVDAKRYVGAQIGIHNPSGERVGTVGRLRNTEYLVIGGDLAPSERAVVARAAAGHGADLLAVP
jgi:adenine-specific DNA-methyltransferase